MADDLSLFEAPLAGLPRIVGRLISVQSPRPKRRLSLAEWEAAVHPSVAHALRLASANLAAAGIRHAVIGAVAVGIHGWARATADVDFLVGLEALERGPDGALGPRPALVPEIGGVKIDYVPTDEGGAFLEDAFENCFVTEHVPIAPVEVVILTKLIRLVVRDRADIVELLKAGLFDAAAVRAYIDTHAPMLTPRYDRCVEAAEHELARGE